MRAIAFLFFVVIILVASVGTICASDATPDLEQASAMPTLEWDGNGVIDASCRCDRYDQYWSRWNCGQDLPTFRSEIERAALSMGMPFISGDRPAVTAQARSAQRGYDPRGQLRQGLLRAPDMRMEVVVEFAGYYSRKVVAGGSRDVSGTVVEEGYKVQIIVKMTDNVTNMVTASGRGIGADEKRRTSAQVVVDLPVLGRTRVGGELSRGADKVRAIALACDMAIDGVAGQISSRQALQPAELVIAAVNGAEVVIVTTDGTDVRDAGVVEGMKYALHGAGVVNPVTNRPSRGTLEIGAIEIVSISADLAQGVLLPGSQVPIVGAQVTLAPYQSLH